MSKEDVYRLWGNFDNKKPCNVEYGVKPKHIDDEPVDKEICIKEVFLEDSCLIISLDQPLNDASISGITYNGLVLDIKILSSKKNRVEASYEVKNLVALFVERDSKKISNIIYINNPVSISERIIGHGDAKEFDPTKNDAKSITVAFGFFNLEKPTQKGTVKKSPLLHKGFWRLPHYSRRSGLSGIISLEEFIKTRVVRFKDNKDEDNFDQDQTKKKTDKRKKDFPPLIQKVIRETEKLLKNISIIVKDKKQNQIDIARWLKGLDILNFFILKHLAENDELPEISKLSTLLLNASRISSWVTLCLLEDVESNHDRLELIRCVQNLFLTVAIYQMIFHDQFFSKIGNNIEEDENIIRIKKALYLRHIVNDKFPKGIVTSEHSQLTTGDLCDKLPSIKAARKTATFLRNNSVHSIVGLEEVIVFENKIEPMLYTGKLGPNLRLQTMLGDEKLFKETPFLKKKIVYM